MLKVSVEELKKIDWRPFLIPAAIFSFVVLSGWFLIRPKFNEIFGIQRVLGKEKKELAQLTTKVASLEEFEQQGWTSKAELVSKALPNEKNVPLMLSLFKDLASKNNLQIFSLQVDPGELATGSAETEKVAKKQAASSPIMSFSLILNGSTNDFKRFLEQASKTAPLLQVEKVSLETEKLGESLEATILVNSPYFSAPKVLGPVDKPLSPITKEEEKIYSRLAELDFSFSKQEKLAPMPAGKENPFSF